MVNPRDVAVDTEEEEVYTSPPRRYSFAVDWTFSHQLTNKLVGEMSGC